MNWKTLLAGAAVAAMSGWAPVSQAQVMVLEPPFDPALVGCGNSDASCQVVGFPASDLIAKYNTINNDGAGGFQFEGDPPMGLDMVFDDFTFSNTMGKDDEPAELISGDWSFTPSDDNPFNFVGYVALQCGGGSGTDRLYKYLAADGTGGVTSGSWACPIPDEGPQMALSNIRFFDTTTNGNGGPDPMPEPLSMALLGLGLAGLGWMTRKRA